MTPGARVHAAATLLAEIFTAWESPQRIPADKLIDKFFKARRYMGSKDRAYIGEMVYWCLRHLASLQWHVKNHLPQNTQDARTILLAALILRRQYDARTIEQITQGKFALPQLDDQEKRLCHELATQEVTRAAMPHPVRFNYPGWLQDTLQHGLGNDCDAILESLNQQAPTDLRVNTLKTTREKLESELKREQFDVTPTPISPLGLRLSKRAPIFNSALFRDGQFEVQDEGSQMVARLVDAQPGHRVIDFCAGAGGKTLAIAADMQNKGRILAWDTSEKRLSQIHRRLKRAGVDNVETHTLASENDAFIKRHKYTADRVLVDVPCSGTGTWRRNPDLKWRFTPGDLEQLTRIQHSILRSAARLVKPGGRLIYATCSILKEENEKQ
ncbi:MAG: RsmB/NOP family class I SAM-dependent RNA methyltransferase, partial [Alphaproteobacteria bacterium]